ncbi:hypothetical protein IE986_08360 [Klebsiella pneumoniae]|uniref:Uncharacterized protein n=1 Tax=Klebsiella pneumoniae TaxID=573 RepID=A0A927D9P0_KLEPN|nr:hypothetical protein [Klebsiella pneumoniae]
MIVPFEPSAPVAITPQPHQIGSIRTEQHAGNIASVGAFTCLHNGQPVAIGGIVPAEKYGLVFDSGIGYASDDDFGRNYSPLAGDIQGNAPGITPGAGELSPHRGQHHIPGRRKNAGDAGYAM